MGRVNTTILEWLRSYFPDGAKKRFLEFISSKSFAEAGLGQTVQES